MHDSLSHDSLKTFSRQWKAHWTDGWTPSWLAATLICSSVAPFKVLAAVCTLLTKVPQTPTMFIVAVTQESAL